MGGGLESRCVGRVYGADGAVHYSKWHSRNVFFATFAQEEPGLYVTDGRIRRIETGTERMLL